MQHFVISFFFCFVLFLPYSYKIESSVRYIVLYDTYIFLFLSFSSNNKIYWPVFVGNLHFYLSPQSKKLLIGISFSHQFLWAVQVGAYVALMESFTPHHIKELSASSLRPWDISHMIPEPSSRCVSECPILFYSETPKNDLYSMSGL